MKSLVLAGAVFFATFLPAYAQETPTTEPAQAEVVSVSTVINVPLPASLSMAAAIHVPSNLAVVECATEDAVLNAVYFITMTYLDSIILGIVEGITEFLPVSSTGHLILASSLLGIAQTDFVKSFEIAIQLGAIGAVVLVYWRSFLDIATLKRLVVAFVPTAIVGYVLYHFAKSYLLGNEGIVVTALFVGGIIMLIVEYLVKNREQTDGALTDLSYKQSFIIGLCQALAIVPGVSRSGATVVGGLLLGIPRTSILVFSFLLAVPTMLAATAYDILKNPAALMGDNLGVLTVGFLVSFLVAFPIVKYALAFVRRYTFVPFAIYRILLALFFWFFVLS